MFKTKEPGGNFYMSFGQERVVDSMAMALGLFKMPTPASYDGMFEQGELLTILHANTADAECQAGIRLPPQVSEVSE